MGAARLARRLYCWLRVIGECIRSSILGDTGRSDALNFADSDTGLKRLAEAILLPSAVEQVAACRRFCTLSEASHEAFYFVLFRL